MRRQLVIMLKEPRVGRVKTRLGRDIGMTNAVWWFRHQTNALLRNLRDPRWQIVLSVSPDCAVASRAWPQDLQRIGQGRGDLGRRMQRALATPKVGNRVLIGADIPGVRTNHIADAFRALGRNDAVFGPATDGGFWLVGFRRQPPKNAFANVRWSSPDALSDTLANLDHVRVGIAKTLRDVDTARDLPRPR